MRYYYIIDRDEKLRKAKASNHFWKKKNAANVIAYKWRHAYLLDISLITVVLKLGVVTLFRVAKP